MMTGKRAWRIAGNRREEDREKERAREDRARGEEREGERENESRSINECELPRVFMRMCARVRASEWATGARCGP